MNRRYSFHLRENEYPDCQRLFARSRLSYYSPLVSYISASSRSSGLKASAADLSRKRAAREPLVRMEFGLLAIWKIQCAF